MNDERRNLNSDDAEKICRYRNAGGIFELIVAFENCTLPPENLTRPALLTVALWYLYMNPLPEARRLISGGIRRYNFEHNIYATTENNFREVLTSGWFCDANDFLKLHKGEVYFVDLINRFLHQSHTKTKEKITGQKMNYPAAIQTRLRRQNIDSF